MTGQQWFVEFLLCYSRYLTTLLAYFIKYHQCLPLKIPFLVLFCKGQLILMLLQTYYHVRKLGCYWDKDGTCAVWFSNSMGVNLAGHTLSVTYVWVIRFLFKSYVHINVMCDPYNSAIVKLSWSSSNAARCINGRF